MSSLANSEQTWAPYESLRDCSQGFCSIYCPEWCYSNIFPPPPPFEFPDEDSGTNFSPLVIAIIGILASAFLLVSYYTVISKYCGNLESLRRRINNESEASNENQNTSLEPWQVSTSGLDETVIRSITVYKYKKGGGFVEGTDCSVCLSEFEDNESLRLLPKCSHAFHVICIDTWLKSHSNCPLCRANIASGPPPVQSTLPLEELPTDIDLLHENHQESSTTEYVVEETESHHRSDTIPKTPLRGFTNLEKREIVIEVRDDGVQSIRRSVSMDYASLGRVSVADILCMSEDDDYHTDSYNYTFHRLGENSKSSSRSQMLHCVTNPVSMKRSFSCGRFPFTRNGKGKQIVIPL